MLSLRRIADALDRIAAADELRNELLVADKRERRAMYEQERRDRRDERDAVIGAFQADADKIAAEIVAERDKGQTWGEALGVDEGQAFYQPPEDQPEVDDAR